MDEGGGVANEDGIAGGAHDHAEHGQPDVRQALGGLTTVTDTQHVTHRFEHRKGVEL